MRVLSSIMVVAAFAACAMAQDMTCTVAFNSHDDTDLCKSFEDQSNSKACFMNSENERTITIDGDKMTIEKATFGDDECSETEYEYDSEKDEAKANSDAKSTWGNSGATQIQYYVKGSDFNTDGDCTLVYDVTSGSCFGAMSAGALAGIIIGAIVGVLLIAYLIGFFLKDSCGIGFLYPCCAGGAK